MAGTYWLTVLPETARLEEGIERAAKRAERKMRFRPSIDTSGMARDGERAGREFQSGFEKSGAGRVGRSLRVDGAREAGRKAGNEFNEGLAAARVGAGLNGHVQREMSRGSATRIGHTYGAALGDAVNDGFGSRIKRLGGTMLAATAGMVGGLRAVSGAAGTVVRHVGTAATVMMWASRAARMMGLSMLAGATALRAVAGTGLVKLAGGLKLVAALANRVATEIARVSAMVVVLMAVARVMGGMMRAARMAGVAVVALSAALGLAAAASSTLSNFISGPLVNGLLLAGQAAGIAAAAIAGIVGPAVAVAKIGFKGLADGAKTFNEQFKDADTALSTMVGQRMGPLLTAFRNLRVEIVSTFSGALTPAFSNLGGLLDRLRPSLTGLSGTLGNIGTQVSQSLASPATTAAFQTMIAESNKVFASLAAGENGLGSATSGLVQFMATAAQTFSNNGLGINEFLLSVGEKLRNFSADDMRAVFDTIAEAFRNVTSVAGPLLETFRGLGERAATGLAPGFRAIGEAIQQAMPGLMAIADKLMPALGQTLENVAPLLPALVEAFTPWGTVLSIIAPHLGTIVAALGPFAPLLLGAALAAKAIGAAMVVTNAAMGAFSIAQGVAAYATGAGTAALAGNTIALTAYRTAAVVAAVASRALGAAIAVATGPIGLIIAAVVAVGVALWAFFTKTETGRRMWAAIWGGIKAATKAVVDWVMNTAVPWLKSAWENIAAGAMWLWRNGIEPVFNGVRDVIGAVVGWIMNTAVPWVQQAWQNFTVGLSVIIDRAREVWQNVKDGFNSLVEFVKGLPGRIGAATAGLWNGLKDTFRSALNWIIQAWNNFRIEAKIPDSVPGIGGKGFTIDTPDIPMLATGGQPGRAPTGRKLSGPGTTTSDDILARLSRSEFVVNAASTAANLPMLMAINSAKGRVDWSRYFNVPAFAGGTTGGLQPGAAQLRDIIRDKFGVKDIGGYRAEDGYGEHSTGRALDVMVGDNAALGTSIKDFAIANAKKIGLKWVIWQQAMWYPDGSSQPMEDRGSPTQNHMDHPHIFLDETANQGLGGDLTFPGGTASAIGTSAGGGVQTAGSSSAFSSAADAKAGGVVPVWVENFPSGIGSSTGGGTDKTTTNISLGGDTTGVGGGAAAPAGAATTESTLGTLTSSSSKEDVAKAIVTESLKRGYSKDDATAFVSTALQESGLDNNAVGGGGAWRGIYQQDTSYAGRDDPNKNIGAFLDRMDEKRKADPNSDIWKRIFWLQQAPGMASADAAYQSGRQGYLGEIQSQRTKAEGLVGNVATAAPAAAVGAATSPSITTAGRRAASEAELSSAGNKVTSAARSKKNADQAVDDRQFGLTSAQAALAEAKANPKTKARALEAAERRVMVAQRELADAKERQADAAGKLADADKAAADLKANGKAVKATGASSGTAEPAAAGGGLNGADFGKTFVSGMLETIGLDGSVFSNPFEWPTIKSLMAGVNILGGIMQGGKGGNAPAATGAAGGTSSAGGFAQGVASGFGLDNFLKPLGGNPVGAATNTANQPFTAESGSPKLAAGEFNPATAGGSTVADSAAAALTAFVPAAAPQAQPQQQGPVDNSTTINAPGQDANAIYSKIRTEQTARTRTTVKK